MTFNRSLLDRIRQPSSAEARSKHDNTEEVVESVRLQIERILNSRQGEAQTLSDYGVPAMSEVLPSYPTASGELQNAIRRSIEQYEPRVAAVRVKAETVEGTPMELRFHITAQIGEAQNRSMIFFETTFDTMGVVRVSG